jgi:hypothetical protein
MILGTVLAESSDGDGGGVMAMQPLIEAAAIEEAVCAAFRSVFLSFCLFSGAHSSERSFLKAAQQRVTGEHAPVWRRPDEEKAGCSLRRRRRTTRSSS